VNPDQEDLGEVLLFVKGLLDRSGEVRCWPTGLDFGEVLPGQELRKTVYFRAAEPVLSNLPKTVRVSGREQLVLEIPSPVWRQSEPTALGAMDVVLNVPEAASRGRFNSSIKVVFALPTPREVMLRIHADVCPGVAIEPGSLYLAVPQDGSVTTAEIRIRSVRRERPFRIQRVSADVPLVCEIVDCNSHGGLIRVQSKPGSVLSRPLHGHFTLDLAEDGLQRVPVVLVPVSVGSGGSSVGEENRAELVTQLMTHHKSAARVHALFGRKRGVEKIMRDCNAGTGSLYSVLLRISARGSADRLIHWLRA
jgi:hypothetical protein